MLELYRVPDSVRLEQFVKTQGIGHDLKQIYLGAMSLEEHITLLEIFPAVQRISFFEDTHSKSSETVEMYNMCKKIVATQAVSKDSSHILSKFYTMLEKAVNCGEGFIALCD